MNKAFRKFLAVLAFLPTLLTATACANNNNNNNNNPSTNPPASSPGLPEATITHTSPRYTNVEGVTWVEESEYWHADFQGKYTSNNIRFTHLVGDLQRSLIVYINGVAYEYNNSTGEVYEWHLGMGHEIVDFVAGYYIIARKDNGDLVFYRGNHYEGNTYEIDPPIILPCTQEEFRYSEQSSGPTPLYFVRDNTLYYSEISIGAGKCSTPKVVYHKSGENFVKVTEMYRAFNNKLYFTTEDGKAYKWWNLDTETVPDKILVLEYYELSNVEKYIVSLTRQGYECLVLVPGDDDTFYVHEADFEDDWYGEAKRIDMPTGKDIDDVEKFYYVTTEDLIVKFNDGKYYSICSSDVADPNTSVAYMKEITALSALEAAGDVEFIFGNMHSFYNSDDTLFVVMDDQNLYKIPHVE